MVGSFWPWARAHAGRAPPLHQPQAQAANLSILGIMIQARIVVSLVAGVRVSQEIAAAAAAARHTVLLADLSGGGDSVRLWSV
jgi:hypothetical protein